MYIFHPRHIVSVFIFLLWIVCLPSATATPRYTDNFDGTITDTTTGIMWMRCSLGQIWTGTTCSSHSTKYDWQKAKIEARNTHFAGYNDWRLPNIRELQTIFDRTVSSPPIINSFVFPNTNSSEFWSSSEDSSSLDRAWVAYFQSAYANTANKKLFSSHVRLARVGQSFDFLKDARNTNDYVNNGDGTVTHQPNCLMWKRCVEGQAWNGTGCVGAPEEYVLNQTKNLTNNFAGYNDWRLPTADELISLVDYNRRNPAINKIWFPIFTHSLAFLSASTSIYSGYTIGIDFHIGETPSYCGACALQVRLVRPVPCFDIFSLNVHKLGTGNGTVSNQKRIYCGDDCTENYSSGSKMTLTATADNSSIFSGWSGDCAGNNDETCPLTMNAAREVSATFNSVCDATVAPLYFTVKNTLYKMNRDGGCVSVVKDNMPPGIQDIAIDANTGTMYFNNWDGMVRSIHLSHPDVVTDYSIDPNSGGQGLAIDLVAKRIFLGLYYTGVFSQDMKNPGVWEEIVKSNSLSPMHGQRGQMQIDPVHQHIYFRTSFNGPCGNCRWIWRVDYDGGNLTKIVRANDGDALALDIINGKLYYSDAKNGYDNNEDVNTLYRANLDGSGVERVFSFPKNYAFLSEMVIDYPLHIIYLNLYNSGGGGSRAIARIGIDGNGFKILLKRDGSESEVTGQLQLYKPE